MSKSRYKWNDKNRHDFYSDLLSRFGPWKFWAIKTNPFSKRDNRIKHDFFIEFLEISYPGKKPKAQLTWLGNMSALGLVPDPNSDLPTEDKPRVPQKNNQRNWWGNKNSAYFAGFVGDEVFPDTFAVDYPQNRVEAWGQDKISGGGLAGLNAAMIPPDEEEEDWPVLIKG